MRLLQAGNTNKNDPNDAFSVAVAALRSPGVRDASRDDHATVLKIWSKRYRDLGRIRTQVACRLHQVLCELIPGGVAKQITAGQAAHILGSITPSGGRGGGPLRACRRVHPGSARYRRGDPRHQEEAIRPAYEITIDGKDVAEVRTHLSLPSANGSRSTPTAAAWRSTATCSATSFALVLD